MRGTATPRTRPWYCFGFTFLPKTVRVLIRQIRVHAFIQRGFRATDKRRIIGLKVRVPMKSRLLPLYLVGVLASGLAEPQEPSSFSAIAERAAYTMRVPGYPDFLVADEDAVWTTNRGRIEKWRHDRPEPVASVPVPKPCGAMEIGFGSVWVANCQDSSLYRIDRQAARVEAVLPTGLADQRGELSIAIGAGSVWLLTDQSGVLSRIDPQTNQITARIVVAPYSYAAVFGFGAVWVTNTGPAKADTIGSVQRVDPGTNRVVATIPVGRTPRFLASGEGGVWVLNQADGSVSRIDPGSNRVVATVPVGADGTGGDIATGSGQVWVRAKKVLLAAIDPTTNRVVERFGPPAGSGAVRVGGSLVWVSAHDVQTLWVLRPRTPAKTWRLNLRLMNGRFSVCRLSPGENIPAWAMRGSGFASITRTAEELSIVCAEGQAPESTKCESGWRLFKIEGPFDFALTGILVSVAKPLNDAGVSILALSTYDTDYVMVKAKDADTAVKTLTSAGHTVRSE